MVFSQEPGFPLAQRWQGVQTIPREVKPDPRNQSRLLFSPIDEVLTLRQPPTPATVLANHTLCAGCAATLLSESGSRFDLLLTVRLPETLEGAATEGEHAAGGDVNVTLGLLLNASDHTEGVNVTLTLSRRPSGLAPLNNAAVAVNGTNTTAQWATHPCSQGRQPGTPFVYCACYPSCGARFTVYPDEAVLTLRVVVDTSILEVFAQGGRAVATKRAYLSSTNREVAVWNNGGASAVVDAGDKQSLLLPCICFDNTKHKWNSIYQD